jgi:molybdopterin-binding protein
MTSERKTLSHLTHNGGGNFGDFCFQQKTLANVKIESEFSFVYGKIKRMQISARNTLKGKVKSVETGAVNTQVVVELPNGLEVVSIITKDSAERLNLAEGKTVYAVVKASDVMIAID